MVLCIYKILLNAPANITHQLCRHLIPLLDYESVYSMQTFLCGRLLKQMVQGGHFC